MEIYVQPGVKQALFVPLRKAFEVAYIPYISVSGEGLPSQGGGSPEKLNRLWNLAFNHFTNMARADAYLVANQATQLSYAEALSLCAAMVKNKTIILLEPPKFKNEVNEYMRGLISKRLNKCLVGNFMILEPYDLKVYFQKPKATSNNVYGLRKDEVFLIRSQVNSYLSKLLRQK